MSLRYIFHLSDLHIRNGDIQYCRYDEYCKVFEKTIITIQNQIKLMQLSFEEFIIIITGDIFHNKNNIGNYGLLLYKDFIQNLTKIGRVIIIHGNHDKLQSEINQPSLVYSSTFNINNLTVLNKSIAFEIDNILFSYVCVDDTLDSYKNSGRIQDLPSFPQIEGNHKYKIALFHGTFASSKLFNGETIRDDNNPYPLEWVQDFDYVLLGDIHKRQKFIYKKKTYCGYSGSLIQQNFGEDIIEHGYLLWNLETKKIKEVNIYNEIGYINIKENESGDILIRKNGNYEETLESVINNNLEYFPKTLEIKSFSKINFQKLNSLLKSYNIKFTIISKSDEQKLITTEQIYNDLEMNTIVDNDYILSYFNKLLSPDKYKLLVNIISNKDYLLFDVNKYPEELHDECLRRNKDLSVVISSCIKNDDMKHIKSSFLIRYLEWEGLLCYENKNWLNMHDLDSKTFMVKGKNGTGKSAIYDILLLAIWGENTKKNNFSAGIINHNKNNAYTIVDIEINGIIYRIQRDYAKRKELTKLNICHSVLYKFINDKELELLKKDSACNNEIENLFGNIDNFLSSSMITQNVDNDILTLEPKKCIELIDKSCNIEYVYHLYNLFKTTINKYRDFRRTVENKKQVYEKLVSNSKIEDINDDEINIMKEELLLLTTKKEKLLTSFNSITIDINDPKNLIILETDYNKINKNNIISYNNYLIYKERYNELKYLLKDEILSNVNNDESIKESLQILEEKHKKILANKLPIVNKPIKNYDEILNDIRIIFKSNDELIDYINNNRKSNNVFKKESIITYDNYKINSEKILKLQEDIKINKDYLLSLEKDFNTYFTKQQEIKISNKPGEFIIFNTSIQLQKEINNINIKSILNQIELDDNILTKYYHKLDEIIKIEFELSNYKAELLLLTTKEEYQYNPKCKFCCKRSWVCRIKELQIIINKLETDISEQYEDLEDHDYLYIYEQNEKNKNIKHHYELLKEWLFYYKSKEEYDKITNELNKIIFEKDKINISIIINNNEIDNLININNSFNNKSYELYETLTHIKSYEFYKTWEDAYNKNKNKIKILRNNELLKIKELLETYDKYMEYKNYNDFKKKNRIK